jgi:prepilin-type N-terminal cleavage/methylation domain-containing protein
MKSDRGFTLLEVLVATAILGIVLLTVYGTVARTLTAANHADLRADINASGRTMVLKIAEELEGALPPSAGHDVGFVGRRGNASAPADAVQFTAVIHRLAGVEQLAGGRAIVAYSLDEMQDAPGFYALRRQEELLSVPMPEGAEDQIFDADPMAAEEAALQEEALQAMPAVRAVYLTDRVAGLRLYYLDPETQEFVEEWDTNTTNDSGQIPGLPAAVHIKLYLADDAGATHEFSTTVDLPLANIVPTPTS